LPLLDEGTGDAHGHRLRNPDHALEHLDRNGGFAVPGGHSAGAQHRTDDRFAPAVYQPPIT
jgi:hypothetical protein